MKSILPLLILFIFSQTLMAQQSQMKKETPNVHPNLVVSSQSPQIQTKVKSFVATPIQADMEFSPILVPVRASPNNSHDKYGVAKVKAEQQILRDDPTNIKVGNDEESVAGVSFEIGESFYADLDNGCPNDNTIAISNSGRIISMMNGHVGTYTSNGTKTNVFSLEAFFNYNVADPCDPKVEYDPVNDRFFMFVQACDSNKENVAMAFSTTNDPNGTWNIYIFPSDALGDGSWSDYPKIAITRDEVFVSLNLFEQGGSGSHLQSIVYQIDKYDGYQGNSLSYKIWDGFVSTPLIIRSGVGQYGPGAYIINTYAGNSSRLFLTDITGNLNSPNSQKKTFELAVDAYEAPPSAYQPDTDYRLDTGDCRAQDGYYQNGTIHFVYTVSNNSYASIRYHRMDPTQMNVNNYLLTTAVGEKDYSYPSIAPFTTDTEDQTAIVHFAASGLETSPEMRAKIFNHDFSSEGSGYVFSSSGAVKETCYNSSKDYCRWGDYSGIAVKYNESQPTVWVSGSVVSQGVNKWWTFIAELKAIGDPTSITESNLSETKVFPNPAIDYLSIHITMDENTPSKFSLFDIGGRMISDLYEGSLKTGENRFTFDTSSLTAGIYFLNITNKNNEIIKTEKIIINK